MIMREARGEWVQYLDADDYLEPNKIERQLDETQEGADADIIYSPVWIETTTGSRSSREKSETSPDRDLYCQWLAWHLPQTGGCLWRREALIDLGGWRPEQPCCQEHELYLRALKGGLRWRYAPMPGAVYRIWSEDTLCRKDPAMVIRVKTLLIDHLKEWMEKKRIWKEEHAQIAGRACLEMARTLAKTNVVEAGKYHRDRVKRGMIRLEGPAAPRSYQLSYRLLGFSASERLAGLLR
jgi:hypothetical protein